MNTATTTWTPDAITKLLQSNDRAVERAIVAIYHRQTEDEKRSEITRHHNKVGFSAPDARIGTYMATWIMRGNHLTGTFLVKGRAMAIKYRAQLADIAASKAPQTASKASPEATRATVYQSATASQREAVGCCDGCRTVKAGTEYSVDGVATLHLCNACK